MLPNYNPIILSIQDHIHLGAVPHDGSNPTGFTGYGAPPYLFGHVQKRVPIYRALAEYTQAWDGTPFDHSLRTADGLSPKVFTDIRYQVRADPNNINILVALSKRRVYLVDNWHCADTTDHTPYVKIMWFADIEYDSFLDQLLQFQIVNILFQDMNTVAPIT